ncbi:MAG: hypothetical protein PWQ67_324 [Clostridia bacterium]|nr:hypothetical protein [Clostridia bacterium]MDN5321870.1 hypothetical protein [Clostridia bacterium]
MLITLARTIILYLLVVIVLRLMGKQQINQLQPFEFVVTLMIAELATIPMEDTGIPLLKGIIPIFILLVAQITISLLALYNQSFRKIISGTPAILIKDGMIMEKELKKNRYNINDLLEQLRIKNYPNVNEVAFALLETNGELSIIPKSEQRQVVVKDLNIATKPVKLPLTLILDGIIQQKNLQAINADQRWLQENLNMFGIKKPNDALIAILDSNGIFYAQAKQKVPA